MKIKCSMLFIMLSCFLAQCGRSKALEEALSASIKKNNCDISLQSVEEIDSKSLALQYQCAATNDLFAGKILYDFVDTLGKSGSLFNQYFVYNSKGLLELELTRKQYSRIVELKEAFELESGYLIEGKYDIFYQLLDKDIRMAYTQNQLVANVEGRILKDYKNFDGFVVTERNGQIFVMFSKSEGNKHIHITYSLAEKMSVIKGFNLN